MGTKAENSIFPHRVLGYLEAASCRWSKEVEHFTMTEMGCLTHNGANSTVGDDVHFVPRGAESKEGTGCGLE